MKNTARRVGAPGVRGLEASPRERRRGASPEHDNHKSTSRSYLIGDSRSMRKPIKNARYSGIPIEPYRVGASGFRKLAL